MDDSETPEFQHQEYAPKRKEDISMVDVSRPERSPSPLSHQYSKMSLDEPEPRQRRKSTLILTEDADTDKHKTKEPREADHATEFVTTELRWIQGGDKVFVTGSFTGWKKMIALNGPSKRDGSFSVKLSLPVGTHRFRFIVDNELRFSDFLPTATDQMGNFVNYLEILPDEADTKYSEQLPQDQQYLQHEKSRLSISGWDSELRLTQDNDDMGNGYSRYHDEAVRRQSIYKEYVTDIPAIFTDSKVMENYYLTLDENHKSSQNNHQWLIPPQLPPLLENVILNDFKNDKDNTSGVLPIPNHVVLNHLATTSIKHNTLSVASVVRFQRKYVTQVLYAPLQ